MTAHRSTAATLALALAGALLASGAAGQDRFRASKRPTCSDGAPRLIFLVDATADDDCSTTGGGVTEAPCLCLDGTWTAMLGGGSGGGVTSVALAVPSEWTVSGSPITSSGTITISEATQSANTIYAGPATGGAAAPGFRALVAADLPYQRLPSMDWPRSTPHAYDCEFANSICGWSWASSGVSDPTVGAIVGYAAVTGTPLYSLSQWPGRLLVQSNNTSVGSIRLEQTGLTLGDPSTLAVTWAFNHRNLSSDGEGSIGIGYFNTGDSNEGVSIQIRNTGSAYVVRLAVENNGSFTTTQSNNITEAILAPTDVRLFLWRDSNTYWGGWTIGDSPPTVISVSVTKTGVTTFDGIRLFFLTANETPSVTWSVDWVRYYSTSTFDFLNE